MTHLDDIRQQWASQCGPCDLGLPMGCTCPKGDPRVVISALCNEVEQLRAALTESQATAAVRQGQLAKSREQVTNLANEDGRLVAENARVRQQRDEALAENARLKSVAEAAKVLVEAARNRFEGHLRPAVNHVIEALSAYEAEVAR